MIKIFIPIYNEEKNIKSNLEYMNKKFLKLLNAQFIVYLVNDGSTDKTGEILNSMTHENLIHLQCNGPSVRENLAQMIFKHGEDEDLIFYMDADLSTNIAALPHLFKAINDGYDIAIGSRYVKGSKLSRTPYRFVVSKIFNIFLKIYFNSKVKDHECGFKLFKARVIKDLIVDLGWNSKRRAFWDSEMLIRAQRKKYKIKQIPITWVEGPKSYISVIKERSIVPYILNFKFKLIRERKKGKF